MKVILESKTRCSRITNVSRSIIRFNCPQSLLMVLVWCCTAGWIFQSVSEVQALRKYAATDMHRMRERVRQMFHHAYDGYLQYGAPYDELRPLSCDAIDTWGSYSLTLIDALDTLAVMGNYTEFGRVVQLLQDRSFDADINVSVFETNIRIIGGLLSAHLLSYHADLASMGLVKPGWPCEGPLLEMAQDVAQRLLPAFDTATGMPYGTVNLRHGVPYGETSVTCTAGIGTFILEFGTLSRLTGNSVYEDVAMNALSALYKHRSPIGLYGNHIDVQTGRWIAQDAGIGAGVDSYFEYLVKGSILLERPELMGKFLESKAAIDRYLKREDWYVWVSMSKGQITLPVFQSLEAYWPGLLSLYGNTKEALRVLHNYQSVWRQYGFLPEFYNIPTGEAGANRENYPLRPELIESVMYLYRATGDPFLLEVGENILESIEYSAKTACGYATIRNVLTHQQEDRMESFFLAETTKYLYLLFDPNNVLHNDGSIGNVINVVHNEDDKDEMYECVVGAGGYIFNTEAHPIDPTALRCCEAIHGNIFADRTSANQNKNNSPRGELFLSKGQRKMVQSQQKENVQQLWNRSIRKEPTFATNSDVGTKPVVDRMTTISLPTGTMNRDVEKVESIPSDIKIKTISSTVPISSKDMKSSSMLHYTESSQIVDDASHVLSSVSGEIAEPSSIIAPKETKCSSSSRDKSNYIIFGSDPMKEESSALKEDSCNIMVKSTLTSTKDGNNENEEDKTMATLLKLVQSMFHTTVGQHDTKRSKFDREKFYQHLIRKRMLEEESSKYNASAPSPTKDEKQHELLLCRAQPYLHRLTLIGEFY
ncbi:ER degradation-enhancing alpha-mannosidase-like protein 2 [Anopheles funestus]|uniref:ER degradation-enhancing alpha-mannosidase-like protein 2 n=1 Tax=Anopheles funestus TaxID=62324 RepID=UPI0020C685CF|nr:ER degradation-enhancing alpha-mannosidase-like protein 2 [Anopheles funestus]